MKKKQVTRESHQSLKNTIFNIIENNTGENIFNYIYPHHYQ